MRNIKQKLSWFIRRHPLWFFARFVLISRRYRADADLPEFADTNEKADVPQIFYDVNRQIELDPSLDSWDKSLEIARYLRRNIKGGRGLGLPSGEALQAMLDGKGGVCSDYSQIFNLFCLINDIRVREWGFVERIYNYKIGHTFNEVWSERAQKWMMLDMGKNLYFTASDETEPASAIELFTFVREGNPLKYHHFSEHVCIDMYKIDQMYSAQAMPFLLIGYHNKQTDDFLIKYRKLPAFAVNALMILLGKHHKFLFVLDNWKAKLF